MARIEHFRTDSFVGAALVIKSQFLISFAPFAEQFIKVDMIGYEFHNNIKRLKYR